MSKSTHQVAVKGVDQTASAFSSIQARAAAASAKMRSMLGGALAAAGAYLSLRAVKSGVDELGRLSDVAQKAGVSVDELTSATQAMGVLGIGANMDQLAKSFQLMEKNTGRTGLQGFYDTVGELGKIPDVSDRAAAAMKVFGKSGMEFMPLIDAAYTSNLALQDVVEAMPRIPQAAADAGDDVADAMGNMASEAKSIWLQGLGAICGWFSKNYEGGVRTASLNAGNHLAYYTKIAVAKCITYIKKLKSAWDLWSASWSYIGDGLGAMFGGRTWSEAWDYAAQQFEIATNAIGEEWAEIDRIEENRTSRFQQDFENREIAIKKFAKAYDAAAVSIKKRELGMSGGSGMFAGSAKSPQIRNELVMGGSNAALRTAMLGPQWQTEAKKQTGLLQKIADATAKTASNTKGVAAAENYIEENG